MEHYLMGFTLQRYRKHNQTVDQRRRFLVGGTSSSDGRPLTNLCGSVGFGSFFVLISV